MHGSPPKELKHYFMFKNMITEEDVQVLKERLDEDLRYQDVDYDQSNKILTLKTSQRDPLSYLRKELFKINPSIEIVEHSRPIRSEDVFNQKYLARYARVGILLVLIALAVITSKDSTFLTPVLGFLAVGLLAEPMLKKAWKNIRHKDILSEDVLVTLALLIGAGAGAYIEAAIATILYQAAVPILNKTLERSLEKIDKAVEMPEMGTRLEGDEEVEVSLYDFEIGDTMIVHPGETVHMPGTVLKGPSEVNTYSNTSTYTLTKVKKGSSVHSGDINVGKKPIYVKIRKVYESSNFMKLMNIASVAPVYESKMEKYTKLLSRFYTPVMVIVALAVCIIPPLINFQDNLVYIHVGAVLLVLAGALSSSQSTSLGILAGFAKAFQNGIIVESSLGLDSINGTQTIVYDRFDGMEVTEEELELFKKLSHIGRTLIIFNDGPVALENDQYMIYNDLTVKEKLEKMDSLIGPIVYIGDSFKDIELLQKSFVGISRGGLNDTKVVESSDIVLIDADLDKVYETFSIARKMRSYAVMNSVFTLLMKVIVIIAVIAFTGLPLWLAIIIEMIVSMIVMFNSTHILDKSR